MADVIGSAFELALRAHSGQEDRLGEPYIAHVVRVAAGLTDPSAQVVALLHDVVEDTDVGIMEIRERFGHGVADAVDAITKREGEEYPDYLERVAGNRLALMVKLSDLSDNSNPHRTSRLPESDRIRLAKKYDFARQFLGEKEGVSHADP